MYGYDISWPFFLSTDMCIPRVCTLVLFMFFSQNNASKALLAVMESHQDMEIVDRIYVKIGSPELLVREAAAAI